MGKTIKLILLLILISISMRGNLMGQINPIENKYKFTELIQKADEAGKKLYEAQKNPGMLTWSEVQKLGNAGKEYGPFVLIVAKNPTLQEMYDNAYMYAPVSLQKAWEKQKAEAVIKYATERKKEEKPVVPKDTIAKEQPKKEVKKDTTSTSKNEEKEMDKKTFNKYSYNPSSRFMLGAGGGGFGVSPLFQSVSVGYLWMGSGDTFTRGWGAYLQGFKSFGDPYRGGSLVGNISPLLYRIGIGDIGQHLSLEVGPSASVLVVTDPSRMAPDLMEQYQGPIWAFGGVFGVTYSNTFENFSRVSEYVAGWEVSAKGYFGPNLLYPLGSYFQTNKLLSGAQINIIFFMQGKKEKKERKE